MTSCYLGLDKILLQQDRRRSITDADCRARYCRNWSKAVNNIKCNALSEERKDSVSGRQIRQPERDTHTQAEQIIIKFLNLGKQINNIC